ncbi:hypothetical protein GCM10027592_21980 [Spirosoma flavus]
MEGVVSPVLHRYVTPLPLIDKVTAGLAQVNVALLGVILAIGALLSWEIWAKAVAVQPFVAINVTE